MAEINPVKFLLNQTTETNEPVTAPAFSITKVIATAAVILTPLTTLLTDKISSLTFSSGQVVVLIVAVLGLLAISSAADVIARSVSTFGRARQDVLPIEPSLAGHHIRDGKDTDLQVVGVRRAGNDTEYLVFEDGNLAWLARKDVAIP